jgi:hypothetical protein
MHHLPAKILFVIIMETLCNWKYYTKVAEGLEARYFISAETDRA